MDDRTALMEAWLTGEWERQRRPMLPPPAANDLDPRGWVHVALCVLGGSLAAALLACWLVKSWEQSNRCVVIDQLRLEGIRRFVGDPNKAAWWKEGGAMVRSGGVPLLIGKVSGIAFGTVIGAVLLLAGCSLYNKLAGGKGSPSSVPEPMFVQAMGITFVTALVNVVMGVGLLSSLASLLVMAAMNSALLPTTLARGFLVALCYLLVGLVVVVVLAVLFGGFHLVLAALQQ